jgi:hypothetical protein
LFAASARALGQQFLPKQKNTDEAGHKDAPIKDQVINWCAARVAAKDDEGRKHANEYAQLLNSVHGRPFNLVLYLLSLSADTCRLMAAWAMSGWHRSRSVSTYCKTCWRVEKMKGY